MPTQDIAHRPNTDRSSVSAQHSRAQPIAKVKSTNFLQEKQRSLSDEAEARSSRKASLTPRLKSSRPTKPQTGPLKSHQRQYQKRKESGLCTATGCPRKSAGGHTHCCEHLRMMSRQHKKRYADRQRESLCIYCGERPGFWGVRCLICRQRFSKDVLPPSARKVLHSYYEIEKKRDIEHARVEARFQARKLLLTNQLTAVQAKALSLFVGNANGAWRTYDEVARLMRLSKQRVHKVLQPLKAVWQTDQAIS
jgi:hypothetical protein